MVDLQGQFESIKQEVLDGFERVCTDASFIKGKDVTLFAENLQSYTGSQYVIPCANGTDAIQIAFMALGLKPGDEVIVPAWTYVATAEVIALLGLVPIFIDVDRESFNLEIHQLERAISPKTKAIVPVHLYGQCAHMEAIMNFATAHNLYVVEDTAQAIGAEYTYSDGTKKHAGTIGHIGTTSFFPSKNLGCYGDGGAIFTQNETLANKIIAICDHGQLTKKYYHDIIGVNSRLDTLQAIVLNAKLKRLKSYEKARQDLAKEYNHAFQNIESLHTPKVSHFSSHVYHQYTLRITNGQRDELKKFLDSKEVPSMIYYPLPLHHQLGYCHYLRGQEKLENSEALANEVISLPMHSEMKEDQVNYITSNFISFFHG